MKNDDKIEVYKLSYEENKQLYKSTLIISLIFGTIAIFILIHNEKENDLKNKNLFINSFYSTIESKVESGKNGESIRVKNIKDVISFKSMISYELNSNLYPIQYAIIGDSIYKNPNSDTIYIIHKNKKYIYPFKIYNDSIKKTLNYK